ncbi:hypothetical protein MNEG_0647, partial [Monoraphidium neglectum]
PPQRASAGAANPRGSLFVRRLLHCAAYGGDPCIVEQLLQGGAAAQDCVPEQTGPITAEAVAADDSATALHVAVLQGHVHVTALLLQRGYDAGLPGPHGLTPLHLAALGSVQTSSKRHAAAFDGRPHAQPPASFGGGDIVGWLWHPCQQPGSAQAGGPAKPSQAAVQFGGSLEQQRQQQQQQQQQQQDRDQQQPDSLHQQPAPRRSYEEVCQALVAAGADVLARDND